jgi:hypothetical protein
VIVTERLVYELGVWLATAAFTGSAAAMRAIAAASLQRRGRPLPSRRVGALGTDNPRSLIDLLLHSGFV